jgi:hypothetical protein
MPFGRVNLNEADREGILQGNKILIQGKPDSGELSCH